MTPATLSATHLGLRARDADGHWRWRLRDVTVAVAAGERVGVLGANGAGKTSLARALGGLERPSRGAVRVTPRGGRALLVLQRPEDHFLRASVRAEIEGYAHRRLKPTEVTDLLEAVGGDPALADRPPRLLSTGQQRAVALACALATEPAFLVLDEPMAGLDAASRRETLSALRAASERRGTGAVLISHHPDDLLGWAQRLWILSDGALIYDGALRDAPVDALRLSQDASGPSLYVALRALGPGLDSALYDASDPRTMARLLNAAALSAGGGAP